MSLDNLPNPGRPKEEITSDSQLILNKCMLPEHKALIQRGLMLHSARPVGHVCTSALVSKQCSDNWGRLCAGATYVTLHPVPIQDRFPRMSLSHSSYSRTTKHGSANKQIVIQWLVPPTLLRHKESKVSFVRMPQQQGPVGAIGGFSHPYVEIPL